MATAYSRRSYNGGAEATTVANGIGIADGSCTIASATGWPSGSGGHFFVDVDKGLPTEEKIECSGLVATLLTFASSGRGADGSTAFAHGANCTISVCHVAQDDDEANQVVAGVLGQSGAAKGDIPVILSAAGPNTLTRVPIGTSTQVLGVSAGLPAWETPTNGYGVTGFAANPMTPAVSLSTAGGFASTNTTLASNTPTAIIIATGGATSTASLAVGTWLVTFNALLQFDATSGAIIDADVAVASGTATLTGPVSGQASQGTVSGAGGTASTSVSVLAVVTVTATLKLTGTNTGAGNAFALQHGQTSQAATGYTAIRIA